MIYKQEIMVMVFFILQMRILANSFSQRMSAIHKSPLSEFALSQDEVNSVVTSYGEAFSLCHENFRMERWNCPVSDEIKNTLQPMSLTKFYPSADKETAYIYSMVAASTAYNFIRTCQMGRGDNCPCGKQHDFTPGVTPCERNIKHGFKRAKALMKYLDYKPIHDKARKEFNYGNILAGLQVLKVDLKQICRCHGVSGHCAVQKCWKTTPVSLSESSIKLKILYNKAKRIYPKKVKNVNENDTLHLKGGRSISKHSNITDLVYLDESPDYCKPNSQLGIKGTLHRECDHYDDETCQNLCNKCGFRKHSYIHKIENAKCNCKFHWCCKVTCETCVENKIHAKCVL